MKKNYKFINKKTKKKNHKLQYENQKEISKKI